MSDTIPDTRTIYDLVRSSLQVQDASNLSGVVHSFSRDVARLRVLLNEGKNFSTDMLNRHPVCVMYASKIASLTGSEVGLRFHRAYTWVSDVAAQAGKDYPLPPLPVDAD